MIKEVRKSQDEYFKVIAEIFVVFNFAING